MEPGRTLTLSFQNRLGKELRAARKAQGLSQAQLAASANLSIPTLRLVERGHGNLASWNKVLSALGLELKGRNLPPGETVGRQIAILRNRQGLGQRKLAAMVGISQPTLIRLERTTSGRLAVLEHILVVLGAGAVLVPKGTTPSFYTHAGNSSAHHGWETPAWLLEALCQVLGTFDLDPCSPSYNQRTAPVQAKVHYTMADDGLSLPWHGQVFVNPPYGRTLRQWTSKAKQEVAEGNARIIVGLVPARTDTTWWHEDVAGKATVLFLRGRLSFGDAGQAAPFPSALVIWGGTPSEIAALRSVLPNAWHPTIG